MQYFAAMLQGVDDCLEQYLLPTDFAPHPLAAYGERSSVEVFPGTVKLCEELGIEHPKLRGVTPQVLWRPTTDLVLVLRSESEARSMLALSFKPTDWETNKRTVELLGLDRKFWLSHGVPWLLITPDLSDPRAVQTLRRTAPWALGPEVCRERLLVATQIGKKLQGHSLTTVLKAIESELGSLDEAQCALWQAVWKGIYCVDLRRGWRPHLPLNALSSEEFRNLNPVASRRSAWKS